MADEIIGEAAEKVAEQGGTVELAPDPVAEAAEHGDATYDGATREVLERMQQRIDRLEADLAASLEHQSRYATSDHSHPHDGSIQVLIDALEEDARQEQAPNRVRFWNRKLWGS